MADLPFGAVSPGGKLPFTWPRTVGQVPVFYAHTRSHDPDNQGRRYWDEQSTPLFPFGFCLSYGRFSHADLRVDEPGTVSVEVANTGEREAAEVVQLFLHQRHGRAARPVRELKGFQRIVLPAGETRRVTFSIGEAERRYWSAADRDWVLDETTFDVYVGGDSTATLTASFSPAGATGIY